MAGRSATMVEATRRHRFTVKDFHRMGEVGIFDPEDERVELLDGDILVMGPIGARHANCVTLLNAVFARLGGRAVLRIQDPVRLDGGSEPLPDVALAAPPVVAYADRHPGPTDVLLLVEVADTTQAYDRGAKLPRYARAGVGEYWIVDLVAEQIEVYRDPAGDAYREKRTAGRGETIAPLAFPDHEVRVDDVLP